MLVGKEAGRPVVLILALIFSTVAVIAGCAKKPAPVAVTEWQPLADAYFPVKFEHPKGWHVASEGTRTLIYSSPDAIQKFHDPSAKAPLGVELVVAYEKLMATPEPLETYVSPFAEEMTNAGYTVSPATPATLDGEPALRIEYVGNVDKKTKLRNMRVYALKDANLVYVQYSAFNELYDFHAPVRDKLLESVKLPVPAVAQTGEDSGAPAAETTTFSNAFLSIAYPANFEATTPSPRGGAEFSLRLAGYRQDSVIQVDVLPAKGLTVEKVFEQNAPIFKGRGNGDMQISGLKAMYTNYAAAASVSGRAYFMVKNDKVHRVVMTWYQPMKDAYLPAFEKAVQSLQVK